ncbi:MAG: hypothetical protein E7257_10445 [Lachnospiraceae bacterium]|nr:hypothetical protein [Lachnospiraceae bacterium]
MEEAMKRTGFIKRLMIFALSAVLTLGMLTGCKDKQVYTQEEASSTAVVKIGEYTIYLDEMIVYAIQDFYLQGGDSATFDEVSDAYRKLTILSTLRENKIIYDVSQNNGLELTEEDKEFVTQSIANFKTKIGQGLLNKYGISDELLERLFYEQACVTKFENDMKNDLGKTIQDDLTKEYADTKFMTFYYMTFPTVEVVDGQPATDANGNYISISEADKAKVKADAEEAVQRISNGEDYITVAQEYGIASYCQETNGYSGAYSEEMNAVIEGLKDGDVSKPLESTLGYNVVVMINSDDENLKESYIYSVASEGVESEFEKLRQMWLGTIEIDAEGDKIGTTWDDFDLKGLLVNMEEAGLVE